MSFSIISDVIPSARRGKAMGTVMSAFSVASVLGVPLGLYLAETFGWRAPFLSVAGLGAAVALGAVSLLPPLRLHLESARRERPTTTRELLGRPLVRLSYLMTATVMMAGFSIIPNISAYLQGNLGYPRAGLKWLYLVGGVASYVSVRLVGGLVDRFGSFRTGSVGAALLFAATFAFFFAAVPGIPPMALFVVFMTAMAFRNVSHTTLTTKVPRPFERARFQSFQSAVQHAASAAGAFLSAHLLTVVPLTGEGGQPRLDEHGKALVRLEGMPRVALFAMALTAALPLLLRWVEAGVRRRDAAPPGC